MKKTKLFPLSILLLFSLAACDRGSSASSSSPSECVFCKFRFRKGHGICY